MIRILHVLGGLNRGGAESMVMNWYRNVDRMEIQFDFIVHSETANEYKEEILKMGGKVYVFPRFTVKTCRKSMKLWNEFFAEHPEYKILHSHVRSYASLYIPIAKKHGLKTIVHSHSTSNGKGLASLVKAALQRPLRKSADFLFSCSREAGEWLFGKSYVDSPKYRMIPNAIDTEAYRFSTEWREDKKKELGVCGKTVYGHVGRLHPAKNHSFLLELFSELHKKNPDSVLLLVGGGELEQEIKNKISELELDGAVILAGSRSDVNELLSAMDVFLFPSLWEGLPVTVVEAQAAGLPCFVSDTVTRDVCVSELVKYLPIDKGVEAWVNAISEFTPYRLDVTEKIKLAGFDIKSAAEDLTKFYLEQIDG